MVNHTIMVNMKTCLLCEKEKPLSDFYKDARRKDGHGIYCKSCWKVRYQTSEEHMERGRKASRTFHNKHKDSAEYKRKRKYDQLRYLYGITPKEYDELLASQNNRCAICKTDFAGSQPHLDHDHNCCAGNKSCGQCRRGLLCSSCNTALGLLKDSLFNLENATNYLKGWSPSIKHRD